MPGCVTCSQNGIDKISKAACVSEKVKGMLDRLKRLYLKKGVLAHCEDWSGVEDVEVVIQESVDSVVNEVCKKNFFPKTFFFFAAPTRFPRGRGKFPAPSPRLKCCRHLSGGRLFEDIRKALWVIGDLAWGSRQSICERSSSLQSTPRHP
eukprot:TRINITY_DN3086_c0_g1_i2.p1 TRINITY_DN3086_c0_g1~~TRINITY_DN3086_c0_g1_i2.p1  ORF type:complete len:150 (+),score=16.96 TRINITY_DN3086_c0_g1_i2:32-481(+)